ncbi:MAG: NADH:flavin oxidoreductase [Deltaproteobacteria bacterium]|nr:NADH:flavin oxidoreductase [Deltaproteobacteria bacterium]
MKIFESSSIGKMKIKNRLIRSATFEGMCDENGFPKEEYHNHYSKLAKNDVGLLITGFSYCSKEGAAIQPGQAGIDSDDKIPYYKKITDSVHGYNSKIAMQIAHTGRQTRSSATGNDVLGVSNKKSFYFGEKPKVLTTEKIYSIVNEFVDAAVRAKKSGFDAVQIHAAHGYLIHQFILPSINNRKDEFGIDKEYGIGIKFLGIIIDQIIDKCGDFPILVKVSASDDYRNKFSKEQFISLIRFLDSKKVDGIEISYGTMDQALNIFRGSSIPYNTILDFDPVYKKRNTILRKVWKFFAKAFLSKEIIQFSPMYNINFAELAKRYTTVPVITVGGFRSKKEIELVLSKEQADFVSLCRPFLAEPDFAIKIKENEEYRSRCINCNVCAIKTGTYKITSCINANL